MKQVDRELMKRVEAIPIPERMGWLSYLDLWGYFEPIYTVFGNQTKFGASELRIKL